MRAASFTMVFTVDFAKPSSCAIVDELCPPPYLRIILIFISKSVAVHFQDGSLFPSDACSPPAIAQNIKIFLIS
jgi:hypothetical protein